MTPTRAVPCHPIWCQMCHTENRRWYGSFCVVHRQRHPRERIIRQWSPLTSNKSQQIMTNQLTLTTTNLLPHHTLSILKGQNIQVARLRSPKADGLHSTNKYKCFSVHWSNQVVAVFDRSLLQTAEHQKPKGSFRYSSQGIVTRTSRPSLTSFRTSELTTSPLPFISPHDPAVLGTKTHSDF